MLIYPRIALDFILESYFESNLVLILVFMIFIFQKIHLCSFDDFSTKSNPN